MLPAQGDACCAIVNIAQDDVGKRKVNELGTGADVVNHGQSYYQQGLRSAMAVACSSWPLHETLNSSINLRWPRT